MDQASTDPSPQMVQKSAGRLNDPLPFHISAARSGCVEAFGALAEHCRRYLLLIAAGELGGDLRAKVAPSDLVQETLYRAQRSIDQFAGESEAELRAWLRQILVNYASTVGRQFRLTSRRDVAREIDFTSGHTIGQPACHLVANDTPPVEQAIRKDQAILLRTAIRRLPPAYQTVLIQRSLEERTFADVGDTMMVSEDAARKLWARAVAALKRELKRGGNS